MRAAIWQGPGSMQVGTAPDVVCPEDGVLLQVLACGICGTDVRSFYNGDRRIEPPWVLGHEISGEVLEIGPRAEAEVDALGIARRRVRALHLDAVVRALPHVPQRRREPVPERRADGLRPPRRLRRARGHPADRAEEPVPHPRGPLARARHVRRPAVGRRSAATRTSRSGSTTSWWSSAPARSARRTPRSPACRAPARCCCWSAPRRRLDLARAILGDERAELRRHRGPRRQRGGQAAPRAASAPTW